MVSTKCQCCNEKTAEFKCSQCLSVEYCSAQCQAEDWARGNHAYECIAAGKRDKDGEAPGSDHPRRRPKNIVAVAPAPRKFDDEHITLKSSDNKYFSVRKIDAVAMSSTLQNFIEDGDETNQQIVIPLEDIPASVLSLIAQMINDYSAFVERVLPSIVQDSARYAALLNAMKYLDISGKRGYLDRAFWDVSKKGPIIDELRLNRIMWNSARLKAAEQSGDPFIVMDSSVSENAGNGLYALRDFEAGERLPMVYPGVVMPTTALVNRLSAYLTELKAETFEREIVNDPYGQQHERLTEASQEKLRGILLTLQKKWYVEVDNIRVDVDWDALFETYVAYRFDSMYWNHYNADGTINADIDDLEIAPLFMNEGSEFEQFENRLSKRIQSSAPNVKPYPNVATRQIRFRALRPIAKYDELIIDYGGIYARTYSEASVKPGTFHSKSIAEDNAIREMYLHADGTVKIPLKWLPPNNPNDADAGYITLQSRSGEQFRVRKDAAADVSPTLRNMFAMDNSALLIPIHNMSARVLRVIVNIITNYAEFMRLALPNIQKDMNLYLSVLRAMKYLDMLGEKGFKDAAFWTPFSLRRQAVNQEYTLVDRLLLLDGDSVQSLRQHWGIAIAPEDAASYDLILSSQIAPDSVIFLDAAALRIPRVADDDVLVWRNYIIPAILSSLPDKKAIGQAMLSLVQLHPVIWMAARLYFIAWFKNDPKYSRFSSISDSEIWNIVLNTWIYREETFLRGPAKKRFALGDSEVDEINVHRSKRPEWDFMELLATAVKKYGSINALNVQLRKNGVRSEREQETLATKKPQQQNVLLLQILKNNGYTTDALRILQITFGEMADADMTNERIGRMLEWLNNTVRRNILQKQYDNAANLVTVARFLQLVNEILPGQDDE